LVEKLVGKKADSMAWQLVDDLVEP